MIKRYSAVLIMLLLCSTHIIAADVAPVLTGNWKLTRVMGGTAVVNKRDIGKIVVFKKEGVCQSYMDNFPKDATYKLYRGFSYASGGTAWLIEFNNTIASPYEVHFAKDSLYLLCSCSEGRHFVFARTKEMLVIKKDTIAKPAVVPVTPKTTTPTVKKTTPHTTLPPIHHTPPPAHKPVAPKAPIKKTVPVKKPLPAKPPVKKSAPATKPAPAKKETPDIIAN